MAISDRLASQVRVDDNGGMEPSPELEAFFELCKRMYERMQREGTWPWPADSTNPENVIDSADNPHDL